MNVHSLSTKNDKRKTAVQARRMEGTMLAKIRVQAVK